MSKSKVFGLLFVVAVLGVGGYYGYGAWNKAHMQGGAAAMLPSVSVINVERKSIYPTLNFVAKIESEDTVGLRARVTGFLQERVFHEGDMVKAGQPLFVIEKVNFEARVREAEANLSRAEAQAANAKSQYDRTKTLFKTKDVSESRLDEMQAASDSAEAAVLQMKAAVDLAKKDLDYTDIIAPMDGQIGESKFSVGEMVGPESGVLATIVKIDPIDAVFSVSENQLLALKKQFKGLEKQSVQVHFYLSDGSEYEHEGQLSFVDNTLDEAMNTLKLKATFPNPKAELISGQYGRIKLTGTKTISDIIIPMRAVQRDMQSSFVYVVTEQNAIEKRMVTTGAELDNFDVIIDSGLKEGEKVVVEGFQKILPNVPVNPTVVQMSDVTPQPAK